MDRTATGAGATGTWAHSAGGGGWTKVGTRGIREPTAACCRFARCSPGSDEVQGPFHSLASWLPDAVSDRVVRASWKTATTLARRSVTDTATAITSPALRGASTTRCRILVTVPTVPAQPLHPRSDTLGLLSAGGAETLRARAKLLEDLSGPGSSQDLLGDLLVQPVLPRRTTLGAAGVLEALEHQGAFRAPRRVLAALLLRCDSGHGERIGTPHLGGAIAPRPWRPVWLEAMRDRS